jgi:hypothetical protein
MPVELDWKSGKNKLKIKCEGGERDEIFRWAMADPKRSDCQPSV